MVIVLTQLCAARYTMHMNPSRTPLHKRPFSTQDSVRKSTVLRVLDVLAEDVGPSRPAGAFGESLLKLNDARV